MQRGGDRDRGTVGRPKRDPVGVAKCEPECEPEHFSLGVAERKSEHVAQLRADRHADGASHGGAFGRALRVADGNDEGAKRVNLDTVTPEEVQTWQPGDTLLLSGKLLTGRDAAHKRMVDMISKGEKLPVDFTNRFIYYVGPVDPVGDEVVGPAGPTTATRMDKFTRTMLEETGLIGMVGKAERGDTAIEAIKDNKAVYLMAVGGAAYLVSKAIRKSRVAAFEDLGMEAIYEFEVEDMPVTVAVDSNGESVHKTGPVIWKEKIAAR